MKLRKFYWNLRSQKYITSNTAPVLLRKNRRLFSASAEARPTSKNILAKEGGPEKLGSQLPLTVNIWNQF